MPVHQQPFLDDTLREVTQAAVGRLTRKHDRRMTTGLVQAIGHGSHQRGFAALPGAMNDEILRAFGEFQRPWQASERGNHVVEVRANRPADVEPLHGAHISGGYGRRPQRRTFPARPAACGPSPGVQPDRIVAVGDGAGGAHRTPAERDEKNITTSLIHHHFRSRTKVRKNRK